MEKFLLLIETGNMTGKHRVRMDGVKGQGIESQKSMLC